MQPEQIVPPRGHQPTSPHALQEPSRAEPRRQRPQPRASLANRCRPDRPAGPPGHGWIPPAIRPQPAARGHALRPPRRDRSGGRRGSQSRPRPHGSGSHIPQNHHFLLILILLDVLYFLLRPAPPRRPHPHSQSQSQSCRPTPSCRRPSDPHTGDRGTPAARHNPPPASTGALAHPGRGPPQPRTALQPKNTTPNQNRTQNNNTARRRSTTTSTTNNITNTTPHSSKNHIKYDGSRSHPALTRTLTQTQARTPHCPHPEPPSPQREPPPRRRPPNTTPSKPSSTFASPSAPSSTPHKPPPPPARPTRGRGTTRPRPPSSPAPNPPPLPITP